MLALSQSSLSRYVSYPGTVNMSNSTPNVSVAEEMDSHSGTYMLTHTSRHSEASLAGSPGPQL